MVSQQRFFIDPQTEIGGDLPLFICGPCVVESKDVVFQTLETLKKIAQRLGVPFVFKSSFDKANRTSGESFRSIGFERSLQILSDAKEKFNVPILTDVHETGQVDQVAEVVDILQIPAFLCRQTDLIQSVARTGRVVNIKKGQFMAPDDMHYAIDKSKSEGNNRNILTERGSTYGYHNLVVDMRSLIIMRKFAPVIFDLTHSIQMPGGLQGKSGGQREFAPFLARAAAAVGVDGFFLETHPDPKLALSDGPNMIPLKEVEFLIKSVIEIWNVSRIYWKEKINA